MSYDIKITSHPTMPGYCLVRTNGMLQGSAWLAYKKTGQYSAEDRGRIFPQEWIHERVGALWEAGLFVSVELDRSPEEQARYKASVLRHAQENAQISLYEAKNLRLGTEAEEEAVARLYRTKEPLPALRNLLWRHELRIGMTDRQWSNLVGLAAKVK